MVFKEHDGHTARCRNCGTQTWSSGKKSDVIKDWNFLHAVPKLTTRRL